MNLYVKIKCKKKKGVLGKKKEEGTTSSFDNSKCPQTKGNYMIILNPKKINTKLKKYLKIYINSINYGLLECPHCHFNNLIMWGHYNRNVIFLMMMGFLWSPVFYRFNV